MPIELFLTENGKNLCGVRLVAGQAKNAEEIKKAAVDARTFCYDKFIPELEKHGFEITESKAVGGKVTLTGQDNKVVNGFNSFNIAFTPPANIASDEEAINMIIQDCYDTAMRKKVDAAPATAAPTVTAVAAAMAALSVQPAQPIEAYKIFRAYPMPQNTASMFLELVEAIFEKAYYPGVNTAEVYQTCIKDFFKQAQIIFASKLQLLLDLNRQAALVEIYLAATDPDARLFVAQKLKFLNGLTAILRELSISGIASLVKLDIDKVPQEKLNTAFADLLTLITKHTCCTVAHEGMWAKMRADSSNVMIMSIGSYGNRQQQLPNFAHKLLAESRSVSVYNFDQTHYDSKYESERKALHELAQGVNVVLPYETVFFPYIGIERASAHTYNFRESEGFDSVLIAALRNATQEQRDEHGIDRTAAEGLLAQIQAPYAAALNAEKESIQNTYLEIILAKKRTNPNFKLALMHCCDPSFPHDLRKLARQLIARGGFELGKDLELISAAYSSAPVACYRNLDKIHERLFKLLLPPRSNTEARLPATYLDAESGAYIFPSLEDVRTFVADPLDRTRTLNLGGM